MGDLKLRVGIFHPALDWYGGAEVVAVVTANSLAQKGYDVVVFVNNPVDQKRIRDMVGEPLWPSIKVIVDPTFLKPRGHFDIYESAYRSLILKSHCDLLVDTYSNFVFPWSNVSYIHFPTIINRVRTRFGRRFLKELRFTYTIDAPYVFFRKRLEDYKGKLIFTNSYFTAKVIMDSLGIKPKVLYPPIPNFFFQQDCSMTEQPREDLVVTTARFGLGKCVELVPDIANLTHKNIHFVMIGLAHDQRVVQAVKNKIRRLHLEERITVVPNASQQDIKNYLARAKVYLHTMKNEHFGISIAEAMRMGCIPVVHNSGGAPEFVPDRYRYPTIQHAAVIINDAIQNWNSVEAECLIRLAARFSETNFSKKFMRFFKEYCESQTRR
jgi:glycosyltransferase involved in cell wall biosynthesis